MSSISHNPSGSLPNLASRQFHTFRRQMMDTQLRLATEEALLCDDNRELIEDKACAWEAIRIFCAAIASNAVPDLEQEDENVCRLMDRAFPLGNLEGSKLGRQVSKVYRALVGHPNWAALTGFAVSAGMLKTVNAIYHRGGWTSAAFDALVDRGDFNDLKCLQQTAELWGEWKAYLANRIRSLYSEFRKGVESGDPFGVQRLIHAVPLFLSTFAQTVQDQNPRSWTLLHQVVDSEQVELAMVLKLELPNGFLGASLLQDGKGRTPLHLAVSRENTELIQLILSSLGNKTTRVLLSRDKDGNTPFHELAYAPNIQNLKVFLKVCSSEMASALGQKNNDGDTPMHLMMRYGSWECVAALIQACEEAAESAFQVENAKGETPWHVLLERPDPALFKGVAGLMTSSLNGAAQKIYGRGDSLLHFAVRYANSGVLKLFGETLQDGVGALMVHQNSRGSTPIHLAVRLGFQEKIAILNELDSEAFSSSLNRQDGKGRLAAHCLVIWEECSALDQLSKLIGGQLITRLAEEDEDWSDGFRVGSWALMEATVTYEKRVGRKRTLLKALDDGAAYKVAVEMIHQRSQRMAQLILGQDSEQSAGLLAMGDQSGLTAMELAILKGSDALWTQMLKATGKYCGMLLSVPSSRGSLMEFICQKGKLRQLETLWSMEPGSFVDALIQPNASGRTPMHDLVGRPSLSAADFVKKIITDIGELPRDDLGRTPFHEACEKGNRSLVKVLFRKGKENFLDFSGKTPLHLAVWNPDAFVLRELLKIAPRDCAQWIGTPDGDGKTPLYHAIEAQDPEALRLLVLHDLDACVGALRLGLKKDPSYTAIHQIAAANSAEVFAVLTHHLPDVCREILTRPASPRHGPAGIALYGGNSLIWKRFMDLLGGGY